MEKNEHQFLYHIKNCIKKGIINLKIKAKTLKT